MTTKIDQKIVAYKVVTEAEKSEPLAMHEGIERVEPLAGNTYKIDAEPSSLYITINNIELEGVLHPYEIFINSKNMGHYQWVVALTRVISAVFRKGGDIAFLSDELKEVFDPKGGRYHKKKYRPSLVSEIGEVIEQHLQGLGTLAVAEVLPGIVAKRGELGLQEGEYPPNATICPKCNQKAAVLLDGCATCLNCGDSKCG